jgi:hypothetical protein
MEAGTEPRGPEATLCRLGRWRTLAAVGDCSGFARSGQGDDRPRTGPIGTLSAGFENQSSPSGWMTGERVGMSDKD